MKETSLALAHLIGTAGLAYIETDATLHVTSWNSGAEKTFGHKEKNALGRLLHQLVPIGKVKLVKCLETEKVSVTLRDGKGKQMPCDIYLSPLMNLMNKKRGVALLAMDISGHDKTRARIGDLEQQISEIYSFAPIGIYHATARGHITRANSEYAWMLGYESSEQVVDQVTDFASQVFYDQEKAEEFMFALFEAEQIVRFRCRLKRRDNSYIWVLCYAKATYDNSGRINGFNGYSIDITERVRAEQALKKANDKLMDLSLKDGLTQIPNRRRFDECLNIEFERHNRERSELSVVLCDIDFFKKYNDTYGHQAGDECLKKVAAAIHSATYRASDLAARYGGEEFGVILPNTSMEGAMFVAERIRASVQSLGIEHRASSISKYVTLSLGVGTIVPRPGMSKDLLIENADKALYEAKEGGRNQCGCMGSEVTES